MSDGVAVLQALLRRCYSASYVQVVFCPCHVVVLALCEVWKSVAWLDTVSLCPYWLILSLGVKFIMPHMFNLYFMLFDKLLR